jgi:transposase-like protein
MNATKSISPAPNAEGFACGINRGTWVAHWRCEECGKDFHSKNEADKCCARKDQRSKK